MGDELAGVELKIGRAQTHLDELKERLGVVLDPDRYDFPVQLDPKTKRHAYKVRGLPAVDPEWSILVGEILYQLRSALDHLAWQLVKLDGGTPTTQTQFPIRDSFLTKNGNRMRLRQLMPEIGDRDILRMLNRNQPYYGGEDGTLRTPDDAHRHGLWILKTLNNIDKHRLLLVVVHTLRIEGMYWGDSPVGPPPSPYLNTAALKEGSTVASFDFHGHELPDGFDPHLSLKVVLRDPEAPLISHVEVAGAMEGLRSWVEWDVVEPFKILFWERANSAP
jgi:hypothetical protein